MVDSDVDGGSTPPEVPDFAEMRRMMERDNRRHVLDGVGCLRPSCRGTLEHRGEMVRCSACDDRIRVRGYRGSTGQVGDDDTPLGDVY